MADINEIRKLIEQIPIIKEKFHRENLILRKEKMCLFCGLLKLYIRTQISWYGKIDFY